MKKHYLLLFIIAALISAAPAFSARSTASLVIQHVQVGCHSWALNGGPLRVQQSVRLTPGGSLTITDNDVMPHMLVQISGAKVSLSPRAGLKHMGASLRLVFAKAGVYRFTTKAGEDYISGVKTIGPDHVLKLSVIVK